MVAAAAVPAVAAQPPAASAQPIPRAPATAEDDGELEFAIVKSPIVGTFYRASEPGARPFAEIGDIVRKGQVLCIIEAMKLMNEIDSEYEGEVVKVYVENGQPVQFGERLFAITAPSSRMFKKILIANRGEIALRVISRPAASSASRPSPSTPRPTSTRCTCGSPTRTSASARRAAPTAT